MTASKQENGIVERSIKEFQFSSSFYGNSIQLNRGIFLPNNAKSLENILDWMQKMLKVQSKLIHVARLTQEIRDDEHMSTSQEPPTSFPISSYVLNTYIDRPSTTLHAPNEGPMRVVSSSK